MRELIFAASLVAFCGCSSPPVAANAPTANAPTADDPTADDIGASLPAATSGGGVALPAPGASAPAMAEPARQCPGVLPAICRVCADGQTACAHFNAACRIVVCDDELGDCADGTGGCGALRYCHFTLGNACGDAGGSGVCAPRPFTCPQIWRPVCGCDGQTYANGCRAHLNGVSIAAAGRC
jgi:hypothetical protein